MELLRGDQTTRCGVRLACGVIALATLALAACNNENQTGPGGANTLVFVGNVNGANASLAGSLVLTVDETRVAATFKVIAPGSEAGTGTGEDGTATIGDEGVATIGDKGKATGDGGTGTGDAGTGSNEAGTATNESGTATNESGTASGGTSTTLVDASKLWSTNLWAGRPVSITAGTGVGQTSTVSSNTATTLTVSPAWTTTPDATSKYVILQTSTTLQDTTKAWSTNLWAGRPDSITAGTGAGQTRTVSSNTKNTLTVSPAWTTTPDGTSKYVILQTSTTLQDTTKSWHINIWTGRPVTITAGTGVGQTSTVSSNTKNTLTVSPAWTTIPDGTSKYAIRQTSTTLQDITKEWPINLWVGRLVTINAGTGAGQASTVTASDSTRLTVSPAWTTTPDGTSQYVIAQTSTTLQDTTKVWTSNLWAGRLVTITAGTGAGQSRTVSSNTTTTLTISPPAWTTTPDGTSQYVIGQTSTTLQDTTKTGPKAWTANQWAGLVVRITAGTGAGQTRTVSSNTTNTLTVSPAWITTPDGTSKYIITASSTALADNTKAWTANQWAGRPVVINAGTGAGQTRTVVSNTTDTLTVLPAWDPIPDGTSEYVITQTATTLQDITKTWTVDQWAGRPVRIAAGAGAGQTSTVSTNTANTLTVSPAWTTMPDATSEYRITQASTKLQDITKTWTTDQWKTRVVTIKAGTGAGQSKTVSSNTANTLTVSSAWGTKPDGSSQYVIGVGATATIALTGTYNSSGAVSASGGGYTFDGTYDGSSRLAGTFTGPTSSSGTFLTERATSNPMAFCGPFTSTNAQGNGIFNVTLSGSTLFGAATAAGGTVFALDGTIVAGDNGTGSGDAGVANSSAAGPGQTSTTLQDTTKLGTSAWTLHQWLGRLVRTNAGFGAGQTRTVVDNDANTLTVSPAWTTIPEDASTGYVIMQKSTTLEDLDKKGASAWTTNQWAGRTVSINAGAGAGQTRTVASNTANTLTVSPAWNLIPDGTSQYVIAIAIAVPTLATGEANSTVSRLAGAFTFGTNQGVWDGARCDQ